MKQVILTVIMLLLLPLTLCSAPAGKIYFVYKTGGSIVAYPDSLVKSVAVVDGAHCITLVSDSVVIFEPYVVDSISTVVPDFSQLGFSSFKFNNKYNDGLPADVICTITGTSITGTAGGLGKYFSTSFQTVSPCDVYVDSVKQESKVTRNNFAKDVTYTLTSGQYQLLTRSWVAPVKHDDPSGGDDNDSLEQITLTADMLSTNAPSGRGQGVDNLIDNDIYTYFHSTWTGDPLYEKLPLDSAPYIDVKLPYTLENMAFGYINNNGERSAVAWRVYGSNDASNWDVIADLTEADGVPQDVTYGKFTSKGFELAKPYSMFRFEATKSWYKNYLSLSEFMLYKAIKKDTTTNKGDVVVVDTGHFVYSMKPFGKDYTVHVDFLTDKGTVPRIDVDIENGATVTSKTTYLRAKFTLDGGGAFDNVTDSVSIKGRGNSSWSGNKRPYHLKFDQKTKLFGLKSGKHWLLIANAQDPTLMDNAVGYKAGQIMGAAYVNHSIPVELYMNGQYYGSYAVTEKIGISNNSIDLNDTTQLFELDTYYDEPYKFRSTTYSLPVMLHNPDFTEDYTEVDPADVTVMWKKIQKEFNAMEVTVDTDSDISKVINIDTLARFMFVNDLSLNLELMHPKSTYLYKPVGSNQYYFGPIWDLDWGYGYELNYDYFGTYKYDVIYPQFGSTGSYRFFAKLFTNDAVKKAYYRLWRDFAKNHVQEVVDYIDVYYNYAKESYSHNGSTYGNPNYLTYINDMKTWIKNRTDYVFSTLTPYPDDPAPIDTTKTDTVIVKPDDPVKVDLLPVTDGLKLSIENGALVIESPADMMLPVYAADGKQMAVIKVHEGHNLYLLLPKGIFIINRHKFRVR